MKSLVSQDLGVPLCSLVFKIQLRSTGASMATICPIVHSGLLLVAEQIPDHKTSVLEHFRIEPTR
jgi:hypothetical protein